MDADPSNALLARRITGGDRAAERVLCERFVARARLYGLRHLRDAAMAADLAQESLLRVLAALRAGKVEDVDRIDSFVLGTCRLVASELRRDRKRHPLAEAAEGHDPVVAPEAPSLDRDRLRGCLRLLPPREQRLLMMSFFEDRSADEIGAALELSAGNVRVLRHRSLARLHACVAGEVHA